MKSLKGWAWIVVAAIGVVAIVWAVREKPAADAADGTTGTDETNGTTLIAEAEPEIAEPEPQKADEPEDEMTAEERAEAEEEKLVDDFDNLTDKWMEPAKNGVTMVDVDAFVKQFATVPKDRKEECLQRALNLIPDENVMLLAGVLMDKTQDKELVELVFNDILNRDEDVKQPILQQILKDKTHPCWADAAWILDVTGPQR